MAGALFEPCLRVLLNGLDLPFANSKPSNQYSHLPLLGISQSFDTIHLSAPPWKHTLVVIHQALTMRASLGLAVLSAIFSPARAAYQGFNYGAFFTDDTPKMQADFEAEFRTAQNLVGAPGSGFTSARLYTMIVNNLPAQPTPSRFTDKFRPSNGKPPPPPSPPSPRPSPPTPPSSSASGPRPATPSSPTNSPPYPPL